MSWKINQSARRWAGLGLLAALLGSGARAAVEVGATFPPVTSSVMEGTVPDTAGKVVVVDFWASWCAPCKTSFPALSQLQNEFGSQLTIVGVSVDEKADAYERFLARMKPSFTTLRDRTQQLVATVSVPTMPTSYVIDRHGVVRFIHIGFHDDTAQALRTQIKQLIEEKS
jgi:thiol-disulfide isomerase/thioredoxin